MSSADPVTTAGERLLRHGDYEAVLTPVAAGIRVLRHQGTELVVPYEPGEVRPRYRGAVIAPWPNRIVDGRYRFDGTEHPAEAVGLVDVLSLSSTGSTSIRADFAEGITASRRRGEAASHEVLIDITGVRSDGKSGRFRYGLVDPEGYAALSARGVAVAIERLLGLAGGAAPGPGLYFPESIMDPAHLVERLEGFGIRIVEMEPAVS